MRSRPHVLVNMAMTADGKIDTAERLGARISGSTDTVRVDRLRADADAILVGGHTLLGEDPRLTVRDGTLLAERRRDGRSSQPTRVGVASRIGMPGESDSLPQPSRFLNDGAGNVVICTTKRSSAGAIEWLEAQGAHVVVHDGPRVDLGDAMRRLHDMGVERLMVEGGSTIVAALFEAGLVDELQLSVASLLFGGEGAPTPVGGDGWTADGAVRLELTDVSRSDDGDAVLRYRVPDSTT